MTISAVRSRANGFSTVIDTIVNPVRAFEAVAAMPTWIWALIVAVTLVVIGTYLQGPAMRHAAMEGFQQATSFTPSEKDSLRVNTNALWAFTYPVAIAKLLFLVLLNTIVIWAGNAIARGQADFKHLWSGSVNIAVPVIGLSALVLGVITTLRGPAAFNNLLEIGRALPSLAWIMPSTSYQLSGFFAAINLFSLWGLFLNATMLRIVGKTSISVAYGISVAVLLLDGLWSSGFLAHSVVKLSGH